MRALLGPGQYLGIAIAVGAVLLKSIPLVLIGATIWVGAVAVAVIKSGGSDSQRAPHPSELDAETRMALKPILALRDQLAALSSSSGGSADVSVIAKEAVAEANLLIDHAQKLAERRVALRRSLRERAEAELALSKLEQSLAAATTDGERSSIQAAIAARHEEIGHYADAERAVEQINSKLREAEASLSELKAKVSAATAARSGDLDHEEVGDLITRLKSLSRSFDEAEELLQDKAR